MNILKSIGYWHSNQENELPDPAWFVDESWDVFTKEKVIEHLQSGQIVNSWMGYSWCRFRCGNEILGSTDLTDGEFIWPEGLIHYVEFHNVRLPDEFVEHILRNVTFKLESDHVQIDNSWWLKQKGWNINKASFKSIFDIGKLTIEQIDSSQTAIQERFLFELLNGSHNINGKYKLIDNIIHGIVTDIIGRFYNLTKFVNDAEKFGMKIEFTEWTEEAL